MIRAKPGNTILGIVSPISLARPTLSVIKTLPRYKDIINCDLEQDEQKFKADFVYSECMGMGITSLTGVIWHFN